ncbi:MAG: hypothetical protein LUI10_10315 [Lachnospiraceae bacterium]|nr:hypothetical protein [Lachnospiraceae bacterium]
MCNRLAYILFIVCMLLLVLSAPVFLFAVQDRIGSQAVYAENQELTVSGVLTNNYIEDDAERMSTYLSNREKGAEYQVVELDSTLNTGEVLSLLQTAFHYDELSYGMIEGSILSQANTQYVICSLDDASNIMFLVTCITLLQHGGDSEFNRLYRLLVDSQTGALYFLSICYGDSSDACNNKAYDLDIFSAIYGWAYEEALDEFMDEIDGLNGYTGYDLLLEFVDWYGSDSPVSGIFNSATLNGAADYDDLVYYYTDRAIDTVKLDISAVNRTTLTMQFPSGAQQGDSDLKVEVVTQYQKGDVTTDGLNYNCRICMGIADFAVWIPRFGYAASE